MSSRAATITFTCDCGRVNESLEPMILGRNEVILRCECGVSEPLSIEMATADWRRTPLVIPIEYGEEPGQ